MTSCRSNRRLRGDGRPSWLEVRPMRAKRFLRELHREIPGSEPFGGGVIGEEEDLEGREEGLAGCGGGGVDFRRW